MKVVLARPHDFLVAQMKTWLLSLGVEPVRLGSLAELEALLPNEVAGVVVSTAVTSSVAATVGEALAAVARRLPVARLAIAGMATVASARAGLAAELKVHHLTLKGLDEAAEWGEPNVALYIQDTDFKPERLATLSQVGRVHFRLR